MLRSNVRSAFDKVFEDALGIYGNISGDQYHKIIQNGGSMSIPDVRTDPYQIGENMTAIYESLYSDRAEILAALVRDFEENYKD